MEFKHNNCIVVFDKTKEKLLFCKRAKEPYQGLLKQEENIWKQLGHLQI